MNPLIQSIIWGGDRALLSRGRAVAAYVQAPPLFTHTLRNIHAWLIDSHRHAETHAARNEDT